MKIIKNDFKYKKDDELEVIIDSISSQGYGICRVDNFVLFVENSCIGDKLKIKITNINKSYAMAKILEVIEPSVHRVKPFCAMQNVCGACQLQFVKYDYQLEIKKQIVQDAIRKIAGLDIEVNDVIQSPQIKEYRHKIQYPVAQTKVSKRIVAGYYKPSSHEIVNIKHCPIQPEICDKIIEFIRNNASLFKVTGYDEATHYGNLKHVVLRVSAKNKSILVVLVLNSDNVSKNIEEFSKNIYENFEDVCGVCVNFNSRKTNVILGQRTKCLIGKEFIEETILDKTFDIGANTFFQINPKSAENIFRYVKNYLQSNFEKPTILDAYAGISAFGICISNICEKVVSIEENIESCELARITADKNNVSNLEINAGDASQFFKNEKRKFDAIILDPPRKGCTKESLDNSLRVCRNKIIYVSCNPQTLARDLKYLTEKGAKVESIQPFDMFCHTYHIESVAIVSVK